MSKSLTNIQYAASDLFRLYESSRRRRSHNGGGRFWGDSYYFHSALVATLVNKKTIRQLIDNIVQQNDKSLESWEVLRMLDTDTPADIAWGMFLRSVDDKRQDQLLRIVARCLCQRTADYVDYLLNKKIHPENIVTMIDNLHFGRYVEAERVEMWLKSLDQLKPHSRYTNKMVICIEASLRHNRLRYWLGDLANYFAPYKDLDMSKP